MSRYWMKRALANSAKTFNLAEDKLLKLKKEYQKAIKTINNEINLFYQKYAAEEGITLQAAKKTLKSKEINISIKEYLSLAQRTGDPVAQELLKKAGKKSTLTRMEQLRLSLEQKITNLFSTEQQLAKETLTEVFEGAYYRNVYEIQKGIGAGREFEILTPKAVDRAISTAWSGQVYSSRIWTHRKLLAKKVEQIITQGVILGYSNQKMARSLSRAMEVSYSRAKTLIRTETNYVYNQATIRSYEATGLDSYIYQATLDLRTSSICRSLDGKKFNRKEAQPGKNYPPMHPNCRSTTIPDVDGAREGTRIARLKGVKFKVPANMTYADWYEKHIKNNA